MLAMAGSDGVEMTLFARGFVLWNDWKLEARSDGVAHGIRRFFARVFFSISGRAFVTDSMAS